MKGIPMKKLLVIVPIFAFTGIQAFGEDSSVTDESYPHSDILILDAIALAEEYIEKRNIDTSEHFISSVTFYRTGELTKTYIGEGPYWRVAYERRRISVGGQYFVFIYIDGSVGHFAGR